MKPEKNKGEKMDSPVVGNQLSPLGGVAKAPAGDLVRSEGSDKGKVPFDNVPSKAEQAEKKFASPAVGWKPELGKKSSHEGGPDKVYLD